MTSEQFQTSSSNNVSDVDPTIDSKGTIGNVDADLAFEHPDVLCFASRNRHGYLFIPSKNNSFGGVQVDNVLLRTGCGKLLLPFPFENGLPSNLIDPTNCEWTVSSFGTRNVPVLEIKKHTLGFNLTLANKTQPSLDVLVFILGSKACKMLLQDDYKVMLKSSCITILKSYLGQIGDSEVPERTFAVLGLSYLSQVFFCQCGNIALALSANYDGNKNIVAIIGNYSKKLVPLVEAFEGFHDLKYADGDEYEEIY
jgi:hypothetical protein